MAHTVDDFILSQPHDRSVEWMLGYPGDGDRDPGGPLKQTIERIFS